MGAAIVTVATAFMTVLFGSFVAWAVVAACCLTPIAMRWPLTTGAAFILAGPLLLSTLAAGPLTADNVVSAVGTIILGLALIRHLPQVRLRGPLLLPLGIVVILVLSIAPHGLGVLFNVARFIGVALLCLAIQFGTRGERRQILNVLNILITISALIIILQPFTGWPAPWGNTEGEGLRYGGLFGHPNFAAYTLALFALYHTVHAGKILQRLILVIPAVGALMLSGSRTAIIVFAVALVAGLLARPRAVWPFFWGAIGVAAVAGATFISRFEGFTTTGGFGGTTNAGGWRFIQWQYALDLAPAPNIWGIGWATADKFLPLGLGVHNGYLQFYVETGLVGCIIFAAALCTAIVSTWKSLSSLLLWAYALVTTFFDPVLMYPSSIAVFVTLLGVNDLSKKSTFGRIKNPPLERISIVRIDS